MAGITGTIKGYPLGQIVNGVDIDSGLVTMPKASFTVSDLVVDSSTYKSLGIELSQKLSPIDPFKATVEEMMNAGPLGKIFGGNGNLTKFAAGAVLAGSAASTVIDVATQGEAIKYVNFYAASDMQIKSTSNRITFEFFYGMNDQWSAVNEVWTPARDLFSTLVGGGKDSTVIKYGMPTRYGWDIAAILATLDLATNKEFKDMADKVKSAASSLFKKKWPWSDATVEEGALDSIANYKRNINTILLKGDRVTKFLDNFTVYELTINLGTEKAFKIAPSACGKISLQYDFSQVDSKGYPLKAAVSLDSLMPVLTLNADAPL